MNPVDSTFLEPVTVNILIVGDGRIGFDTSDFSLSRMIEALSEKSGPVARFSITTAYRKSSGPTAKLGGKGAQHKDFEFDDERLKNQDELWLFGYDANERTLTSNEQAAIERFMQKGGVLATGDHEDLGAALNEKLPRVKTMRTWRNGPPVASGNIPRHDTINNDVIFPADPSEEDSIPQKIIVKMFPSSTPKHPHPLLDDPNGVINVLPDHMHEGNCREPSPAEMRNDKYPLGAEPLLIAHSNIRARIPQPPFGAIGAYDGHRAKVGRIVVDSSFHHFVNSNLKRLAEPDSNDNLNRIDTGTQAYESIKTYYRNIALWLAPPEKQKDMFAHALWEVRWRSSAYDLLAEQAGKIDMTNPNIERYFPLVRELGKAARSAMAQLASRSFAMLWSIEWLVNRDNAFFSLYPWLRAETLNARDIDEEAIDYIIGGVMMKMASGLSQKSAITTDALTDQLDGMVNEGAEFGLMLFKKL